MSAAGAGPALSRRRFLRRTFAGAALLAVGGAVLPHLGAYRIDAALAARLRVLSPKEAIVLSAIAARLLAPDAADAPTPAEVGVLLAVDNYLAELDPSLVSDLRALLHLVEHTPLVFAGRPGRFSRLSPAAQDAVLAGWEQSRLGLRRRGLVALRSLCALGYYGDPRTHALLGYRMPPLPAQAG